MHFSLHLFPICYSVTYLTCFFLLSNLIIPLFIFYFFSLNFILLRQKNKLNEVEIIPINSAKKKVATAAVVNYDIQKLLVEA